MDETYQRMFFKKKYNVSCETIKKFDLFYEKLLQHQKNINLIGKGTLQKIWIRHFLDSAGSFDIIKNEMKSEKNKFKTFKILDVGSGPGFPGMVLGILFKEFKNVKVTLIESNKKKSLFLNEVKESLGINIEVINERVENLTEKKFDFITARAVSKLDNLFKMCDKILNNFVTLIFFKGRNWRSELLLVKKKWNFKNITVKNKNDVENTGGVIMIFKEIRKV